MQKQTQPQPIQEQPQQNVEQNQQQQITPQTLQQFSNICLQATQLMNSYKEQSECLKQQITSMVTVYNKNVSPSEAVPLDKIMEVTQIYQTQMKQANQQYNELEGMLRKQEQERDGMIKEIQECFKKLERMDEKLKAKKQAKLKAEKESLEASENKQKKQQIEKKQ